MAEQPILLSSFFLSSFVCLPPLSFLPCKSDLLEVGISGHGAHQNDRDDERYILVQEIWSGSEISKVKLVSRDRRLSPGSGVTKTL